MLSEPRAIFFQTVLEWPPVELCEFRIGKDVIRQFFNKLFEHEFVDHHYENLDLQAQKPTLSTRNVNRESICQFGDRSITIEERRPDFAVEGFTTVVKEVLRGLKAVADEIDDYVVPPFFVQRCRVNCLSQPMASGSSLKLLAARVANVMEVINPFERPPSFFGVRFRFSPVILETEDAEDAEDAAFESFASVRFETYSEDPSQVWMEVAATHPLMHVSATLNETEHVIANMVESYEFLTLRCKAFLDQFDTPDKQASQEAGDDPEDQ